MSAPVLLNIFVNNLKLDNNSTVVTFADDIALGDITDTSKDKGVYKGTQNRHKKKK